MNEVPRACVLRWRRTGKFNGNSYDFNPLSNIMVDGIYHHTNMLGPSLVPNCFVIMLEKTLELLLLDELSLRMPVRVDEIFLLDTELIH